MAAKRWPHFAGLAGQFADVVVIGTPGIRSNTGIRRRSSPDLRSPNVAGPPQEGEQDRRNQAEMRGAFGADQTSHAGFLLRRWSASRLARSARAPGRPSQPAAQLEANCVLTRDSTHYALAGRSRQCYTPCAPAQHHEWQWKSPMEYGKQLTRCRRLWRRNHR